MSNSLIELIAKKDDSCAVWVRFQDTSFEVLVAPYGKAQMAALSQKARTSRINFRTMQQEDDLDKTLFRKLYAEAVIKDWRGLTGAVLAQLVVLDKSAARDSEFQLQCTPENKETLIEHSLVFDQWLASITQDMEVFNNREREANQGN